MHGWYATLGQLPFFPKDGLETDHAAVRDSIK